MDEDMLRGDTAYQNPNFLDDLLTHLREGGRKKAEALQKRVEATSHREGVYVVHGFVNDFETRHIKATNKSTGFLDKLEILLTMQPTISASTIRPGDDEYSTWGALGVILNGGTITGATKRDRSSSAEQRNNSTIDDVTLREIKEAIEELPKSKKGITTMLGSQALVYNELFVREPSVAGLYITLRENEGEIEIYDARYNEHKSMLQHAQKLSKEWGLPLYGILNGEVVTFSVGEDKKVKVEEKLSRSEVLKTKITIPEQKLKMVRERILTSAYFRGDKEEFKLMQVRDEGRRFFTELYLLAHPEIIPEDAESYFDGFAFSGIYGTTYYLREGDIIKDDLHQPISYRMEGESGSGMTSIEGEERKNQSYAETRIGRREYGFFRDLTSEDEGLEILDTVISNLTVLDEATRNAQVSLGCSLAIACNTRGDYVVVPCYNLEPHNKEDREYLAAFVYGFAEEARRLGRDDLATQASELAKPLLDQDTYREIRERRITPEERFRTSLNEVQDAA
jgi:hypothetical protein